LQALKEERGIEKRKEKRKKKPKRKTKPVSAEAEGAQDQVVELRSERQHGAGGEFGGGSANSWAKQDAVSFCQI
jgi:hypothetical protein